MASSSKTHDFSPEECSRLVALFESIGFAANKAEQTVRNPALSLEFERLILAAGVDPNEGCSPAKGMLIYEITTGFPKELKVHGPERETELRDYVLKALKTQRVQRSVQLKSAFDFLKKLGPAEHIDDNRFDRHCGVGLEITQAQIDPAVADVIAPNKAKIDADQHKFNRNAVIGTFSRDPVLKFADLAQLKSCLFAALDNYLGPDPSGGAAAASSSSSKPAAASSKGPSVEELEIGRAHV